MSLRAEIPPLRLARRQPDRGPLSGVVWLEAKQLGVRGWRLGGQGEVSARRTRALDGSLRGFTTVNRSPFHDECGAGGQPQGAEHYVMLL